MATSLGGPHIDCEPASNAARFAGCRVGDTTRPRRYTSAQNADWLCSSAGFSSGTGSVRGSARHWTLNHERRRYRREVPTSSVMTGSGAGSFGASGAGRAYFSPGRYPSSLASCIRYDIAATSSKGKCVTNTHSRHQNQPETDL